MVSGGSLWISEGFLLLTFYFKYRWESRRLIPRPLISRDFTLTEMVSLIQIEIV